MSSLWETTEIGRQLIEAPWQSGEQALFIVVKGAHYKGKDGLGELNKTSASCECLWIQPSESEDNKSDSAVSVSTVTPQNIPVEFGAIALRTPGYLHEKRGHGLSPCFLLGRQSRGHRYADVWLSRDKSVSRTECTIGLKNGCWVIRVLGTGMIIHGNTLIQKGSPSFALHPHLVNRFKWLGGLQERSAEGVHPELEIYCRDSSFVSAYLETPIEMPDVEMLDTSQPSSIATASLNESEQQNEVPQRLYVFSHLSYDSRTDVKKYLALDPWTCVRYIAKNYPLRQINDLEERVKLQQRLPTSGRFIYDEALHIQDGEAFLLTALREGVVPLRELQCHANPASARRFLWDLLRLLKQLHGLEIYHNDICLDTIFVNRDLDDEILLGGLSEASTDPEGAIRDCFDIFQAVRDFLGHTTLRYSWLGHAALDNLWRLSGCGRNSWTQSAHDICNRLAINLEYSDELWTTVNFSKEFKFRFCSQGHSSYLSIENVKDYLKKDAILCSTERNVDYKIEQLRQKAFTALSHSRHGEWISVAEYHEFQNHMKNHHSSNIGKKLALSLPDSCFKSGAQSPTKLSVRFKVPYHARYGLINFQYLCNLASVPFDTAPFLNSCYELRGSREIQGVYIAVAHLPRIAQYLGLHYESNEIHKVRDESLKDYTSEFWYLIVANESSQIFPVNRETQTVRMSDSSDIQLSCFIRDFLPQGTELDITVVHDPAKLNKPQPEVQLDHSCEGSVEPSIDELHFEFSQKPRADKRPDLRTSAWVDNLTPKRPAKRQKRHGADIIPTILHRS